MPRREHCADHLLLLGEMLDAATQYVALCDTSLEDEETRWSNSRMSKSPLFKIASED
jgi:hypothetical protein